MARSPDSTRGISDAPNLEDESRQPLCKEAQSSPGVLRRWSSNGTSCSKPSALWSTASWRPARTAPACACLVLVAGALACGLAQARRRSGPSHVGPDAALEPSVAVERRSHPSQGGPTTKRLVNLHTGLCLDWMKTIVRAADCKRSFKPQDWVHTAGIPGFKTPDGRCLDHGGKTVHVWRCFEGSGSFATNQVWKFNQEGQIVSPSSNLCLSVDLGSHWTHAQGVLHVKLETCQADGKAQTWGFVPASAVEEKPPVLVPPPVHEEPRAPPRKKPGGSHEAHKDEAPMVLVPPAAGREEPPPVVPPVVVSPATAGGPCIDCGEASESRSPEMAAQAGASTLEQATGVLAVGAGLAAVAALVLYAVRPEAQGLSEGLGALRRVVWNEEPPSALDLRFLKPRPEAVLFTDPRPGVPPPGLVGVCGFYYPGFEERWDRLCGSGFLGNLYDLGPDGLEVTANGVTRTFRNAEAAFQALKFWHLSEEFSSLSGEQALQKKLEFRGQEDYTYGGYGSGWNAMWAVLEAKFQRGSALGFALQATSDAFLLEYEGQHGSAAGVWDENCDVGCENWLGLQLMLVRDRLTGDRRWTEYLDTLIDTSIGRPYSFSDDEDDEVLSGMLCDELPIRHLEFDSNGSNGSNGPDQALDLAIAEAVRPYVLSGDFRDELSEGIGDDSTSAPMMVDLSISSPTPVQHRRSAPRPPGHGEASDAPEASYDAPEGVLVMCGGPCANPRPGGSGRAEWEALITRAKTALELEELTLSNSGPSEEATISTTGHSEETTLSQESRRDGTV